MSKKDLKDKLFSHLRTEFKDNFSGEVWASTYKDHKDQSIDDTLFRVAQAAASVETTPELKEEWTVRFYDLLSNFRGTAGGRIYANAGTEWGGTTLMNCLAAETPIHTDKGIITAKDIPVGSTIKVLTSSGRYEDATWNNYGKQRLYAITFQTGETVYATEGHEWVVSRQQGGVTRVPTKMLVGKSVELVGVANYQYKDLDQYRAGIKNGLVFGDGYKYTDFNTGASWSALQQFGDSRHLVLDIFGYTNVTFYKGDPEGIHYVLGLPSSLKDLPDLSTVSQDYLRGFMAGVIAADGFVDSNGSVGLHTANYEYAVALRRIAISAGIPVVALHVQREGKKYSQFATEDSKLFRLNFVKRYFQQDPLLILKNSHRERMISSPESLARSTIKCIAVEPTDRVEEVFCCDQPSTHTLVIGESGILTGNCYVGPRVEHDADSLDGILTHLRAQAHTLKSEGGWGENFSYIRPRGAFINGIGVETPGAVKYMELFDKSSEIITSGSGKKSSNGKAKGKIRKGAMMGVLDVWHPDIIEFITAKQQPGRLTKFNVSVNCTDEFMNRVVQILTIDKQLADEMNFDQPNDQLVKELQIAREQLDKWDLRFPETTFEKYKAEWNGNIKRWEANGYPVKVYNTVSVMWLWNLIMESTYNRAEPGVLFLDRANFFLPLNYAETVYATNPCGEQTLAPGGVCNLGSLNLTQFVNEDRTGFDLNKIKHYTRIMVRFLDNINDLTKAPLPEYAHSIKNKRRIGVGILGWGSALYMLKTRFASEHANELREEVMSTIAKTAYEASIDLAEEKGMFSFCDPKAHAEGPFVRGLGLSDKHMNKLRKTGIRNSSLLSIQPTGNTSILANVVSGGLEPVFLHEYIRTVIVNTMPDEIVDVCPRWFEGAWHETEMFKFTKEGDEEILRGVAKDGTVYKIDKNRGLTKEVLCEDYGVHFMKSIGEWDPAADWAATALGMSVNDHVSDLKGFARWVDSAMSKCVAEGTLITTDKGIKPIETLAVHTTEDDFVPTLQNLCVLDENGQPKRITKHYYGGKKQCKTIRFDNGFDITAALTHKLKTAEGWKSFDELQEGDKVFLRTNATPMTMTYQAVPQPTFAVNAIHKTFPAFLDEDFAMLIGMWIADGSTTEHSISICEKNDKVEEVCAVLMKVLFGTHKQQLDDRWNVRTHYAHSSSIARWFREHFGHGAANKHLPQWLLDSPPSVLRAFIAGLTLDGYLKKDEYNSVLVVYDGYSKDVAIKVSYMLSAMGIQYSLMERDVNGAQKTYGVSAWLVDKDTIVPIEEHKRNYSLRGKTQNQTYVSTSVFEQLLSQQPRNTYGAMMRARLRKCMLRGNFVRMSFLDVLGVEYDAALTCTTITSIDDAGMRKVYDIEVEDTHSYLINGIVSHNTVNVPNDYPFEDFKNIYLDSYKSGYVKGVTTYRSGTMTTVLAAKDEKNASPEDEEIILEDVKLPDSAPATMKILKAEGVKYYVTVIWNLTHTRPFALFVQTNRREKHVLTHNALDVLIDLAHKKGIPQKYVTGTLEKMTHDTNATKVARAISLLLRHGVLITNIVSTLDKVEDAAVGSFVFHIKKFLASFIKDGESVVGQVCLNCGSSNIVYQEGCSVCKDCGSSKCS